MIPKGSARRPALPIVSARTSRTLGRLAQVRTPLPVSSISVFPTRLRPISPTTNL